MKIIQVNNEHRLLGGSDFVARSTVDLLRRRGHEVYCLTARSSELGEGVLGRIRAFMNGLYSRSGVRDIRVLLTQENVDIVHVHELYPFISPWILPVCRQAGVPVVMTCHDHRLSCPIAFHINRGHICERCANGSQLWCVIENCRRNIFESISYSLRSTLSQQFRLFGDNVTIFIALAQFAKNRLQSIGVAENRICVIPNASSVSDVPTDASKGKYIAYVGRIAPEKGLETLIDASRITGLPVKIAGDTSGMPQIERKSPDNVTFIGRVDKEKIEQLYREARFIVVPSECYEMCPLVISEAMGQGLPVIASDIGGLAELVVDGKTGLLFRPGNKDQLASQMRYLWNNPKLCFEFGLAGWERAGRKYTEDHYYTNLVSAYEKALTIASGEDAGLNHTRRSG